MSSIRIAIPAAAVLAVACAATVQAGDLPSRSSYPAAPVYTPEQRANFTGLFAGVHAGGGFGSSGPTNTSGILGGVQVGYNHQLPNNVVLGAEADITASNVRNNGYTEKTRQNWMGSARVKAGYAFGNVMPYVTGGLSGGTTEITTPVAKTTSTGAGWVVGAGAEMMLTPNVSMRGEYLYYALPDAALPTTVGFVKVENSVNVFRGGMNYKF
jgi:outer membrane immunogenic protein